MAKAPNYTEDQMKEMLLMYNSTDSESNRANAVEFLARDFGKPVRSIIAKLSNMGVYVKPEPKTKDGKPIVKKDATADAIGAVLQMTEAETTSMAKANKSALEKVWKFIRSTSGDVGENASS